MLSRPVAALAASLYLWSDRLFRIFHTGAQVAFEGFWMGALPEAAWDRVSMRSYGGGEEYTGPAYLDSGLQFWEDLAVRRFFAPGSRVLVAAAGGGREMIALARAGYEADGFECSRPMVSAGQRALADRGIQGRLTWAPPCKAPSIDKLYDALIVGWNGYTYISPRRRRLDFIESLRPHLRPGAPVLVSAAFRSGRSRSDIWVPRIANAIRRCTFRAPVFEAGARFPGRPRHQFNRKQLEREWTSAGFSVAAFYRWGPFGAMVVTAPLQ